MKFLLAIVLPAYLLDQATKWWALSHFALVPSPENLERFPEVCARTAHLPEALDVIPGWFQLVYWANTGAAFSIGRGNNWFFILLSFATLAGLLIAWAKKLFTDAPSRWGVALLMAGILGNVTDRLIHRHVVDFLLVDLHVRFANPWPAFNVADSCICVAAGLFVIAAFKDARKPR
jgi:signal peptidase II